VVPTAPTWRRSEEPAWRSEAPVWRRMQRTRRRAHGGGWMRRRSEHRRVWGNDMLGFGGSGALKKKNSSDGR
jgi:hypothetical protein